MPLSESTGVRFLLKNGDLHLRFNGLLGKTFLFENVCSRSPLRTKEEKEAWRRLYAIVLTGVLYIDNFLPEYRLKKDAVDLSGFIKVDPYNGYEGEKHSFSECFVYLDSDLKPRYLLWEADLFNISRWIYSDDFIISLWKKYGYKLESLAFAP